MLERRGNLVDRFVAKGSRLVLGLLGALVFLFGAWVALQPDSERVPTRYGPFYLMGLGLLAVSFAFTDTKRVHPMPLQARLLSLACLAISCLSFGFGFILAVVAVVQGDFDSMLSWTLVASALLLLFVIPFRMLKLGARFRPPAEREETREKIFRRDG